MTIQQPALFLQGTEEVPVEHSAEVTRRGLQALVSNPGVVGANDLHVTQTATPGMGVTVSGGQALIFGTESTYQGMYIVENRGDADLAITAAHASNARIDLVVARVRDSNYSGSNNDWQLSIVTGTAASSPVAPSVPDNAIVLAQVYVDANATSILDAKITDTRVTAGRAAALGGIIVCTSSTRPTGVETGQFIIETDTQIARWWNGSGWTVFPSGTSVVSGASIEVSQRWEPGDIKQSARSTPTSGWLVCDGSAVLRSTYADLFAAIGTTYGAGNGTTTFNLPDLRGRVAVGAGTGTSLTARTLGATGGEENHVLTTAELPAHAHASGSITATSSGNHAHGITAVQTTGGGTNGFGIGDLSVANTGYNYSTSTTGAHTHGTTGSTANTGSGSGHNTMQPFTVINYMIKT